MLLKHTALRSVMWNLNIFTLFSPEADWKFKKDRRTVEYIAYVCFFVDVTGVGDLLCTRCFSNVSR